MEKFSPRERRELDQTQKFTRLAGTLPEVTEAANDFWGSRNSLVELSPSRAWSLIHALLSDHPC